MWQFIRQIFQLLLSPARGWEDVSEAAMRPDVIQRSLFYPWIGIVAASQLLRLIYDSNLSVITAIEAVIVSGAAMFASLYIGRYGLQYGLFNYVSSKINPSKVYVFSIYMISIGGLFGFIANIVPPSLTIVNILPLISLLIIYKATTYLDIPTDRTITYFFWAIGMLWLQPMLLVQIMMLII